MSLIFFFTILTLLSTPLISKTNDLSLSSSDSQQLDNIIAKANELKAKRAQLRNDFESINNEQKLIEQKIIKIQQKIIPNNDQKSFSDILQKHSWDLTAFGTKGFWSSLTMIIISEIGDKTFFIAAILAMKHSRIVVWTGAASALFAMTLLAVIFGTFFQYFSESITHYAAAVLFLIFGFKLLYDASKMKGGEASDELREAEEELAKREIKNNKKEESPDLELNKSDDNDHKKKMKFNKNRFDISVLTKSFVMTFISEIGDRSQITTVVLASHKSPFGVALGASVGHGICTGIAVLGGKLLAARISEKNVTLIGGVLFLLFGIESFIFGPGS